MEQSFSTVWLSLSGTNRGEGKGWLLRLLLTKLNIEHTSAGLHMLPQLFHESNAIMVVDCRIFMIAYCELVLSMLHITRYTLHAQNRNAQRYNVVTMLFSKPVLRYSFFMLHSVPDLSLTCRDILLLEGGFLTILVAPFNVVFWKKCVCMYICICVHLLCMRTWNWVAWIPHHMWPTASFAPSIAAFYCQILLIRISDTEKQHSTI